MTALALAATAAIMITGLLIAIRCMRPTDHGVRHSGLRSYRNLGPTNLGTAIVAALAAGSIVNPDNPYGAAVTGAIIGILLAVVVPHTGTIGDLGLGLLGALASLNTAATTLATAGMLPAGISSRLTTSCAATTPPAASGPSSVIAAVAVVAVFVLACATTLAVGRLRLRSGLALFGALDLLTFLTAPLGIPLAGLGQPGIVSAVVVAAALGAGSAFLPELTLTLTGIAISIAVLTTATLIPTGCTSTAAQLAAVLTTLATWIAARRLTRARLREGVHRS